MEKKIILGIICGFICISAFYSSGEDQSGLIQMVILGVKENENQLSNYHAKFKVERQWNEEAQKEFIPEGEIQTSYPKKRTEEKCEITWEAGKFAFHEKITFEGGVIENIKAFYNGRHQKRYREEHNTGLVKSSINTPLLEGIYRFHNQSFRYVKNMSMSDYLQKCKINDIEIITEKDKQVFVFDTEDIVSTEKVPVKTKIYIDSGHGYALKRVEFYRSDLSKEPRIILEVDKFKEVMPGIFFPMEAHQDMYVGGQGKPVVKLSTVKTVVEDLQINLDLPKETFEFQYPVGTLVYDEFLGSAYTVGTTKLHLEDIDLIANDINNSADTQTVVTGKKGVLSNQLSEESKSIEHEMSSKKVADVSQDSLPNSNNYRWSLLSLIVIAIVLTGVVLFINQKNKREHN